MAWPQMTVAILLAFQVVGGLIMHGIPRPPWNFYGQLFGAAPLALILHAGGFWK